MNVLNKQMLSEINSIVYIFNDEGFPSKITLGKKGLITIENEYSVSYEDGTLMSQLTKISDWKKSDSRLEFLDRIREIGYKYGFVVSENVSARSISYSINIHGKVIDQLRKARKVLIKGDKKNDVIKIPKMFQWNKDIPEVLILEQSKGFNIYLTNHVLGRFYIIIYADSVFGGDKSKLKCISILYNGKKSGDFIIYDNYRSQIGRYNDDKFDMVELQSNLNMSNKSFDVFNRAWYYIEENYNKFKYP